MTSPTNELTTAGSDVPAIADLARAGATPHLLEVGNVYVVQGGNGEVQKIDLTTDQYVERTNPRRLETTVAVNDVDSLLAYWDKHNDEGSDVYADRDRRTVTAILDAHHGADIDDEDRPRWQTHRAVLTLSLSEAFTAWLGADGKYLTQEQFAEFVEDWMPVILDPPAADLVEMAQHFQAHTSATFKAGVKLQSGARVLQYTESIEASSQIAGGEVAVPTHLTLRLPIWRGSAETIEMTARIRFRLNHGGAGKLGLGFKLDRPTEAIDAAFEAEVARIAGHVARPVLRGTPAGAR